MGFIVWKCACLKRFKKQYIPSRSSLSASVCLFGCRSFYVCVCLEASLRVGTLLRSLYAGVRAHIPFLHPCLCVRLSPVAASSGPHNPQERVVSFFTVTGSSPRRVARGLQTNSVWPESPRSSSSSSLPPITDHGPCRSADREMVLAAMIALSFGVLE